MSGCPEKRRKVAVKKEPSPEELSPEPSFSPSLTPPPANLPQTMSANRYTRAESLNLLVGPDEEEILAHSHYVTRNSTFFQVDVDEEHAEGQRIVIKLPGEEVEVIAHYLDFVYGEGLPTKTIELAEDITQPDGSQFTTLFKLYTLGERIRDKVVRSAIIKETIRLASMEHEDREAIVYVPSKEEVNIIYDGTSENSPARRLLEDLHVSSGLNSMLDWDGYNPDYFRDLAKAFNHAVDVHKRPNRFRYNSIDPYNYRL